MGRPSWTTGPVAYRSARAVPAAARAAVPAGSGRTGSRALSAAGMELCAGEQVSCSTRGPGGSSEAPAGRVGSAMYAWCTSPGSAHTVAGASGPSATSRIGSVSRPNDSGKAAQRSRSERCRRNSPTRAQRPSGPPRSPRRSAAPHCSAAWTNGGSSHGSEAPIGRWSKDPGPVSAASRSHFAPRGGSIARCRSSGTRAARLSAMSSRTRPKTRRWLRRVGVGPASVREPGVRPPTTTGASRRPATAKVRDEPDAPSAHRTSAVHGRSASTRTVAVVAVSRPTYAAWPRAQPGHVGAPRVVPYGRFRAADGYGGFVPYGTTGECGAVPGAGGQQPLSTDCRALFSAESTVRL